MNMQELMTCPHCNGNGRIVSVSGFKSDRYRVVCEECGASTRECETKQEAVSAWNMRAGGWIPVGERLPMIELKPCPFCGGTAHLFVNEGVRVICPNCGAIMDEDTQEREGGK